MTDSVHAPISAEKILQKAGGIYKQYGKLKKKSIGKRCKMREIIIRIVSRFTWGRQEIRKISRKRISE